MTNIVFEALEMAPRPKKRSGHNLLFNCPACVHQNAGHRPDRTWRGGATVLSGNRFVYNCHNCQFKTGWTPGGPFSRKVADLMSWCGISQEIIRDISFLARQMRYEAQHGPAKAILPDGLKSCREWADANCTDRRYLDIATFLQGFDPPKDLNAYHWTPDNNGMALDTYVIVVEGPDDYPTAWRAIPLLDMTQPFRTNNGVQPDIEDEPTDAEMEEMERLMRHHPDGIDEGARI